jgi:very-short-patch-repair endonuclease
MSGLVLLGLALVIFVVWHFLPEADRAAPSPKFRRDLRARADDPKWQSFVEEHCESPAETAFLRAMINAHELRPLNGSLLTDGLKIDLQVQERGYRVDFLANEWLVIEIDGAAYHSTKEAKARDQQRDEYFESLGYSVLRIPAKVVFTDPTESVRRVQSALNAGKRQVASPVRKSGLVRLGETMSGIAGAMESLNDSVSRARKIRTAVSDAEAAFSIEKSVIEAAIESATSKIKVDEYIGTSQERRDSYERFYRELDDAFKRADQQRGSTTKIGAKSAILVPAFSSPNLTGNADVDAAVGAAYSRMAEERDVYLDKVRRQMRSDPRLGPMVKDVLTEMGCPGVWVAIS